MIVSPPHPMRYMIATYDCLSPESVTGFAPSFGGLCSYTVVESVHVVTVKPAAPSINYFVALFRYF